MMFDEFEYGDFVTVPNEAIGLAELQKLALLQVTVEAKVKKIEAELNAAKEQLREIAEKQLPELMDSVGMETFKTNDGIIVKVREIIRASIPKASEQRAFAWLRASGNGAMIKRQVIVPFGMGEEVQADSLSKELMEEYEGVEDKSSVHPSTLAAFVSRSLKDGNELPLELFGVHRQRVSKISI